MNFFTFNRLIACTLFFASFAQLAFSQQNDSTFVKTDRHGTGNSTFGISVNKLENIIHQRMTRKMLESSFGQWQSDANFNEIQGAYDEKTKDFTIPLFELHYDVYIKGQQEFVTAEISSSLKNPIRILTVTTYLGGYQLAQFKESLHTNGFLLNEHLSGILQKLSYQKKNDCTITIKYNANGSYTIGVMK